MLFNLIDTVSSNSVERKASLVLDIPDPLLCVIAGVRASWWLDAPGHCWSDGTDGWYIIFTEGDDRTAHSYSHTAAQANRKQMSYVYSNYKILT